MSKIYGDYTIQLQNQRLGYLVLGPLMDTFMLRLGAHYGPTVVSTEVQEQNLTWVQTGHTVLPNQTIQVYLSFQKRDGFVSSNGVTSQGTFQLQSNPVQNSS